MAQIRATVATLQLIVYGKFCLQKLSIIISNLRCVFTPEKYAKNETNFYAKFGVKTKEPRRRSSAQHANFPPWFSRE
jgi:hypothetical protein